MSAIRQPKKSVLRQVGDIDRWLERVTGIKEVPNGFSEDSPQKRMQAHIARKGLARLRGKP